uniref:Variant erythrocyte surface antigen-1, beta subunit n=1 Tax=Babesia bovis TaxID=5865 RepID=A7ASZ0_BABBO|eukprot:XP_001609619.1 variant erythrocyte surface antigen-1, beta subunit [Babesia bovis T2Bo]
MAQAQPWPYTSLTTPPTNLKEAIDWVLRVTGRDGKKNDKAAASPPKFGCLCYLAKAVKDLLYDARSPGTPGPSTERNWNDILLKEEKDIVKPVLTDLGLLGGSTGAASSTCAGGTEVIGALIDQLAQGLQKWVGWQDKGDECCLKGAGGGVSEGIGRKCTCPGGGGGAGCCSSASSGSCQCATAASGTNQCGYKSSYKRPTTPPGSTTDLFLWTTLSDKPDQVHLLARIFLGSVCLIWSGLSQLGWLTRVENGEWYNDTLSNVNHGLGSFMAAMGYDLERLNQGGTGSAKTGTDVAEMLTGKDKAFPELKDGATKGSVAEYYSSIYEKAKEVKDKKTESICKEYPLLVLHILASGYFRAGSAGANKVTPAKPATTSSASVTPSPRKPRTIREILYWLSALPYCDKYRELVQRMGDKTDLVTNGSDDKNKIVLHGEGDGKKTDLHKDKITHYLMAACGYCPLVLIGIQGTIEREVEKPASGGAPAAAPENRCPEHSKDRSKRCKLADKKTQEAAQVPAAPAAPAPPANGKLTEGQVCYGGYHLEVSKFGPLHGMYANGLYGFDLGGSAAQCLDQLRIYVYHCFYQLYFLRKQCTVGVVNGSVLGWQSCRYGSGLRYTSSTWSCSTGTTGVKGSGNDCQCKTVDSKDSPLMSFLCDGITALNCPMTRGKVVDDYHPIETHWTTKDDNPKGHFGTNDLNYPKLCPVPMGWSAESPSRTTSGQNRVNHFKGNTGKYPAHCTGNTLSLLLEYYCDPEKCQSGTLVVLLRLLACITPTVPRTLGDLFGFYYYIVYIGGQSASGGGAGEGVYGKLKGLERESKLYMLSIGGDGVVKALETYSGDCQTGTKGTLKCLTECDKSTGQCCQYLSPLSGQQYGQLSPLMAGTYLSWLVYLIGEFQGGLQSLEKAFKDIQCKEDCRTGGSGGAGCGDGKCQAGTHGDPCSSGSANQGVCGCTSVVSCTGVLPVLYKYGFGYGNVTELHSTKGLKKCHEFLRTLESVLQGDHLRKDGKGLHHEINQLIYTTRLPWIFVLTIAWLMAVLYLAFGAIWPLDWTHMRSHCRGWFRKGSLSPWEILMVGKKKGRGILEFFGGR